MISRRRLVLSSALLAAASLMIAPTLADSLPAESPEDFILDIANRAYEATRGESVDNVELERLVLEAIDLRRVGFFSLGKYSRQISAKQKAAYNELFPQFAVQRYVRLLRRYGGRRLVVRNSIKNSSRDYIIFTRVLGDPEFDGLEIQWRVLVDRNGEYALIDVGGDGIWLGVQQRDEFASIIDNNGGVRRGGFDVLLRMMREEIGSSA